MVVLLLNGGDGGETGSAVPQSQEAVGRQESAIGDPLWVGGEADLLNSTYSQCILLR